MGRNQGLRIVTERSRYGSERRFNPELPRDAVWGDWPHLDIAPICDLDRDANHDFRRTVLGIIGVIGLIILAVVVWMLWANVVTTPAHARDDGRFVGTPLKQWFDQLASGKGLCCSFADGHAIPDVDWDTQRGADGVVHYRVWLDGQWIEVPDAALVTEPNRFGAAVVWPYRDDDGARKIRCFIPGAGT